MIIIPILFPIPRFFVDLNKHLMSSLLNKIHLNSVCIEARQLTGKIVSYEFLRISMTYKPCIHQCQIYSLHTACSLTSEENSLDCPFNLGTKETMTVKTAQTNIAQQMGQQQQQQSHWTADHPQNGLWYELLPLLQMSAF